MFCSSLLMRLLYHGDFLAQVRCQRPGGDTRNHVGPA